MNRDFDGMCLKIGDLIEHRSVRLLFEDSWYWLHYEFFPCRDSICSEKSSVVRTHLLNLAAHLYRGFDELSEIFPLNGESLQKTISELVEIAQYAENFPICLWISGDDSSKEKLISACSMLPSVEQTEFLMSLPHSKRRERERLSYAHDEPCVALKRYRSELAEFNRRTKHKLKNAQRSSAKRAEE